MPNIIKRLILEATETPDSIRKKLYPNIKQDIFNQIISADPTTTEEKMGKYSNWLLTLYKEGNLKLEDLYKATEYLTTYNEDPKKYPKLYNIKDLPTLYEVISQRSGTERQVQDYSDVAKDKGAEMLYRDSEWILLSPKTQEASCKYGAGTQWCTAATKSENMFGQYNEQGKLYILIDRKNNRKWQFHFETMQFMDASDSPMDYKKIEAYVLDNMPDKAVRILDRLAEATVMAVSPFHIGQEEYAIEMLEGEYGTEADRERILSEMEEQGIFYTPSSKDPFHKKPNSFMDAFIPVRKIDVRIYKPQIVGASKN